MDASQSSTPDLTFEYSPPHFPYEFNSDSSGSPAPNRIDGFTNYGDFPDSSAPLGAFNALALGILLGPTNSRHMQPQLHSHGGNSGNAMTISPSASSSGLHGRMDHPLPGSNVTNASATAGARGEGLDDGYSTTCPPSGTKSRRRRRERFAPYPGVTATRPARTAARRSATTTARNLRVHERDTSGEGDTMGEDTGGLDAEVDGGASNPNPAQHRTEETRLHRIESEQRRRDELRDGYARLKDTLPSSKQKSSKVSLLDRAVTYICQLEAGEKDLQTQLDNTDKELKHQRDIHEGLVNLIMERTRALPATSASVSASTMPPVIASQFPGTADNNKNNKSRGSNF